MRLYRWLLRAYPPAFRERYAREMELALEDAYRDARQEGRSLAGFWLDALADLVTGVVRERWAVLDRRLLGLWLLALLLASAVSYVDSHNNEVQASVLLLLVFSFGLALAWPRRAWRWALIVGLGVPVGYFGRILLHVPTYPAVPNGFATFVALIPAFIGAYCGAFMRWFAAEAGVS